MRINFNKKLTMYEKENAAYRTNDDYIILNHTVCNPLQRKREYNIMVGR